MLAPSRLFEVNILVLVPSHCSAFSLVVRYSEEDFDTDGKPDQLTVKISMPITEQARRVFFLGTFGYTLQETVRLSMKGLIAADESCGVGATGMRARRVRIHKFSCSSRRKCCVCVTSTKVVAGTMTKNISRTMGFPGPHPNLHGIISCTSIFAQV